MIIASLVIIIVIKMIITVIAKSKLKIKTVNEILHEGVEKNSQQMFQRLQNQAPVK